MSQVILPLMASMASVVMREVSRLEEIVDQLGRNSARVLLDKGGCRSVTIIHLFFYPMLLG